MDIEKIKIKLSKDLSQKRYIHSLSTMEMAVKLAEKYSMDVKKAELAGLLHDCAKNINGQDALDIAARYGIIVDNVMMKQTALLHGPIGACIAKDVYHIDDKMILESIRCHTTGKKGMSTFDKIIFIADYIEPNRNFSGVEEIRQIAFNDLNKAMIMAFDKTIIHVMNKNALIHPDTVHARNDIMLNL